MMFLQADNNLFLVNYKLLDWSKVFKAYILDVL